METQRLYPAIAGVTKESPGLDLRGHHIPKGATIYVSVIVYAVNGYTQPPTSQIHLYLSFLLWIKYSNARVCLMRLHIHTTNHKNNMEIALLKFSNKHGICTEKSSLNIKLLKFNI